jgi:hypothetical protein
MFLLDGETPGFLGSKSLPAIRSDLVNRRHHVRIRQTILARPRAIHFGNEKVETSAQDEVKVDPGLE